jgi:hypothetical protein
MESFAKRPMVVMKMIRYPPLAATLPGQFGVGAHTDFGGVTVLLQEPGRHGLEVWIEEKEAWLPVKAIEDVYVINCGDMIMKWSGFPVLPSSMVICSPRTHWIRPTQTGTMSVSFWSSDSATSSPFKRRPLPKLKLRLKDNATM